MMFCRIILKKYCSFVLRITSSKKLDFNKVTIQVHDYLQAEGNTEVDIYLPSYLQSRLIPHEYGKGDNISPLGNEEQGVRSQSSSGFELVLLVCRFLIISFAGHIALYSYL